MLQGKGPANDTATLIMHSSSALEILHHGPCHFQRDIHTWLEVAVVVGPMRRRMDCQAPTVAVRISTVSVTLASTDCSENRPFAFLNANWNEGDRQ